MALLRGKLFAGALFAGLLVGGTENETPVVPVVNEVIWTQGTHGGGGASNGQAVTVPNYDWRSIDDLFKKDKAKAHRARLLDEDEAIIAVIMQAVTEELI